MATVKAFAKTLLKNLTFLAGIYVCFRYLGDFTSVTAHPGGPQIW
jgi:hypothetical protein